MTNAALSKIAGTPFGSQQRNRRLRLLLGCLTAQLEALRQVQTIAFSFLSGIQSRLQGIENGLLARLSFATRLHTLYKSSQQGYYIGFGQLLFPGGRDACA